jgi:hypothetical protein
MSMPFCYDESIKNLFQCRDPTMSTTHLTEADTLRAKNIWAEYQKQHDVSHRKGQAAGIDPVSRRVWFGESIVDIGRQLDVEGVESPLYFVRVGHDYYYRKGGSVPN